MSRKFAIIGNGYWGDILNSKLSTLGDVVYFSNSRNFEQLSKDIDWVFVATPSLTHFEIARKLLIRGFNVFIEKPPCFSVKEYTQLVEVANNSNCKFCVDNVFLFRSELKDKIELLDSKFIKYENTILETLNLEKLGLEIFKF
jgi:predicted dehydrogenase